MQIWITLAGLGQRESPDVLDSAQPPEMYRLAAICSKSASELSRKMLRLTLRSDE